jgi:hypothetical protein
MRILSRDIPIVRGIRRTRTMPCCEMRALRKFLPRSYRFAMQLTPRRLTTHQKAVLIQVLLSFPDQRVGVSYCPSASDALDYAQDFLTVFKVIGWSVNESAASETLSGRSTGLAFVVAEPGGLPPSAEALRDALRIYGIEVVTICDATRNKMSASFILSVGSEIER